MQGTEKQVKYAEDIRKAIFEAIESGKEALGEDFPKYEAGYKKIVEFFNGISEAKVFISIYKSVLYAEEKLQRMKQLHACLLNHIGDKNAIYRYEYAFDEDISRFITRSTSALRKKKKATEHSQ